MKKFKDIEGFKSIKCEAKVGTDKLKELHYRANDIIFKYNMQFAFPRNVEIAEQLLKDVFIEIKDLDVNEKAQAKKDEILKLGRVMVANLIAYRKQFKYDESCVTAIEGMCKYRLSDYLKKKDSLTIADGVSLLRDNQALNQIVGDVSDNLNIKPQVKAFIKMQDEIIEIISKQLKGYSFTQVKSV